MTAQASPVFDRTAWLEERRTYLGGTDIAAIVGAHPYKSPLLVYQDKLGLSEPQPETAAMRRGTQMEPYVAGYYAEETGWRMVKAPTVRHSEKPYLAVNPDYYAEPDDDGGGARILVEIKTHNIHVADRYGEAWSDQIPEHELIQCQWEMHITGIPECHLVVLFGLDDLRTYRLYYDPELAAILEDAADRFWREHVLAQVPPDLSGASCEEDWLKRRYPSDSGTICYSTPEIDEACCQLGEARRQRKTFEVAEEQLAIRIKGFMGDAAILSSSVGQFSWKQAKDSTVVDWKAVAYALSPSPELIQQHTTIKPGSRRFLTPFKDK